MAALVIALALALALVGCGPKRVVEQMPVDEIQRGVTVEGSEFDKNSTVIGIGVSAGDGITYRLRSFVPRTGGAPLGHQLYVHRLYTAGGWIHYAEASDDDATTHEVLRIGSEVVTCWPAMGECMYAETVGVRLSDAFLRERAERGLRIRLSAVNGDGAMVISVPPNYIQAQLAALPK